jgi:hypothetical protein
MYKGDDIESMLMLREFLLLCDSMNERNISFVPLKGPVLSERIYGDATLRKLHDLDFLTDYADIDRIHALMLDRGYLPETPFDPLLVNKKRLFYHFKDVKYFQPETGLIVEFHWRLFTYDVFVKNDTQQFLKKYTFESMFMGRTIRMLKSEFELLYITIHGAEHRWFMLKWLVDTNDYLRNVAFNKDVFNGMCSEFRLEKLLGLCNLLSEKFIPSPVFFETNTKVPVFLLRECVKAIERKRVQENSIGHTVNKSLNKLKFQFLLIPHKGRRFYLIRKYIRRDLSMGKISKLVKNNSAK